MEQRVSELDAGFRRFVDAFSRSERFGGPSVYFHRKSLQRRANHVSIDSLLGGCVTWMTSDRACRQAERFEELRTVRITNARDVDVLRVVEQVWSVLTEIRVSIANVQIVANSKALHHLLPELVPPMDREYTFRFFYGRNSLTVDERTAFGRDVRSIDT